jgi:hypothetical protein
MGGIKVIAGKGARRRQEARGVIMPTLNGMDRARAESLLTLIESESKDKQSQFAGMQISDRPFTAVDIEQGRRLFTGIPRLANSGPYCISYGPVAMRGFPAPSPLNSAKTLTLKDGRMYHILTYGQKNMPSYASQVSEDDRWKAILYVRSFQRSAQAVQAVSAPPPAPIPPTGQERQK